MVKYTCKCINYFPYRITIVFEKNEYKNKEQKL